jgi:N-acetylglutamate synthase-like GNAT family acetyltransferase
MIREATAKDIAACLDIRPTMRAWVAENADGKIIAFGGYFLLAGRWYIFLELDDEMRAYKMTLMRTAKRIMAAARQQGIRYLYAMADPEETKSRQWLESLGFRSCGAGLMRWQNG